MPWLEANGLLPGRGAPGRAAGRGAGEVGFGAGEAAAAAAPPSVSASATGAGVGPGAGSAFAAGLGPGLGPGLGAAAEVSAAGASDFSAVFSADFAAVLAGAAAAAAAFSSSPYCFLNRISTGGSTVEEADFTNSPISFSFSRTNLLSTPNSLASSWTRVLATKNYAPSGSAGPEGGTNGDASGGANSSGRTQKSAHELRAPVPVDGSGFSPRCSASSAVVGPSLRRNALANARRRTAESKHAAVGCRCAPRPGAVRSGSGTTAVRPSAPEPATTRNNSVLAAFSRQPMHVRTGPETRVVEVPTATRQLYRVDPRSPEPAGGRHITD